ncbi:MAG: PEGA domain-containing protein [Candidatus Nomurabacteria bacterium]|jgi:hypothetical protein|nr:PEGA domain-containing protein [Candidatus Nomurabacteria bacterium]
MTAKKSDKKTAKLSNQNSYDPSDIKKARKSAKLREKFVARQTRAQNRYLRPLWWRSFIYGVMTLAVVGGVAALWLYTSGWRLNLSTGKTSQVALLQFKTIPAGATIDINGKKQKIKTPNQKTVKTGQTTIKFSKNGYRDWNLTLNLKASEVRWLNYIRLLPVNIQTDSLKTLAAGSDILPSSDHKWLMIWQPSAPHKLTLADISDPTDAQFYTLQIPDSVLKQSGAADGQAESFSLASWDSGSRYILIKRTIGIQTEFIKLDRKNPDAAVNLTEDFGLDITQLKFYGSSGNIFYGLTDGNLRKFDTGAQSASAPIATGVSSYRIFNDDQIVYVANVAASNSSASNSSTDQTGAQTSTGASSSQTDPANSSAQTRQVVGIFSGGKTKIVRKYSDNQTTLAEFTHYYDHNYLAIARGGNVILIRDPLSDEASVVKTLTIGDAVDYLEFDGQTSHSGRILLAGRGDAATTYDIEKDETFHFQMSGLNGRAPVWLDDFYLADKVDGGTGWIEFDGANPQTIAAGSGATVIANGDKYLFSEKISGDKVCLQRSKLFVDN